MSHRPRYVVHVAGDPHEGTQACRRCAQVLVEHSDNQMGLAGPNGEPPVTRFFPAGAEISQGNGWTMIGVFRDAVACR